MLALRTLRRWLLAGVDTVSLKDEEAVALGLADPPRSRDPARLGRMLRAFMRARALERSAAPRGRMVALNNPWPGLRSLIGPREWVAEQDVSSRALRQARYELPAAQKEAVDVNFARHRRLFSDLRMAPALYLRGHPEHWGGRWPPRGAPLLVAAEYIRQGRADLVERDLLSALELPVAEYVGSGMLRALRELDAQRAHAFARRVLAGPAPPDMTWTAQLVLADDPSAEPLLRRWSRRRDDGRLGALAALFARAADGAGAALEAHIQARDFVGGARLARVIESLSARPRWLAATASMEALILRRLKASATASGLVEDRAARSYGPKMWATLLSACPPSEENAAAIARHRTAEDELGVAELSACSRAALRTLLMERGLDGMRHWESCAAVSRLSPAEAFEIFSDGIEENERMQQVMLEFIDSSIEGGARELRAIEWDRRWLQLGLDRGLPRVVAGVLGRQDRAAARMVINAFGALKEDDQLRVIRRFSKLNLPERLDAILAAVKSPGADYHMPYYLAPWVRPWSDGPALARALEELRSLPEEERLPDYVLALLANMTEGYTRMDPRS